VKATRTIALFALAWLVFAVTSAAPVALAGTRLGALLDAHPTLPHFITKTLLVVFVVLGVAFDRGRSWSDYGFRAPVRRTAWWRVIGVGGLLGALAAAAILLTPAQGMTRFLGSFGFLGLVLSIWLYSSVTEEVFVRGWFQTVADRGQRVSFAGRSVGGSVLASALLFGSLHLSLLSMGSDALTVVIIVTATTLLGLAAARFREQYQSVVPSVVTHISFNVGGFVAGVIINTVSMVATGKLIQK
jgi:membrane protease YdiL (CAAX protease family)